MICAAECNTREQQTTETLQFKQNHMWELSSGTTVLQTWLLSTLTGQWRDEHKSVCFIMVSAGREGRDS